MSDIPVLKDWKSEIEEELRSAGHGKDDLRRIVLLGRKFLGEITPSVNWVHEQSRFVSQVTGQIQELYRTRFNEDPSTERSAPGNAVQADSGTSRVPSDEIVLDTPERRKKAVQKTALELAPNTGDEIRDRAINEELKRRNMRLVAQNPTALISTIMNGFKAEFEKVEGKRGIFKRAPQKVDLINVHLPNGKTEIMRV